MLRTALSMVMNIAGLTDEGVRNDVRRAIPSLVVDAMIRDLAPVVRTSFLAEGDRRFLRIELGADPDAADDAGQPWTPDGLYRSRPTFMRSARRTWVDFEVPAGHGVRMNIVSQFEFRSE
ncbi:hypothetical protein ACRYCC_25125 [Actinomadura scrupuli]|uniref:hypothetical protein n=1 Tax=Actinomadura scrupuli TaxID=559629 RepID=UPI003D954ED5